MILDDGLPHSATGTDALELASTVDITRRTTLNSTLPDFAGNLPEFRDFLVGLAQVPLRESVGSTVA